MGWSDCEGGEEDGRDARRERGNWDAWKRG